MIPCYGFGATSGKIYTLDDSTVLKDSCVADGTGGTAFVPYFVSNKLRLAGTGTYSKLRRFLQKIAHVGNVTIRVTAIRDSGESTVIDRTLAVGEANVGVFPLNDPGSDLQIKLEVTSYDGAVALSDTEFWAIFRREVR